MVLSVICVVLALARPPSHDLQTAGLRVRTLLPLPVIIQRLCCWFRVGRMMMVLECLPRAESQLINHQANWP